MTKFNKNMGFDPEHRRILRCMNIKGRDLSRKPLVYDDSSLFNALCPIVAIILAALIIFIVWSCRDEVFAFEMDMDVIAHIESSGNPLAWNKNEDSRGLYQITPILLKEWNNFHPKRSLAPSDLWNPAVSYTVAYWYLNVRIPQMIKLLGKMDTIENRIIAYNAGVNYVKTGKEIPPITKRYIDKYVRLSKAGAK